MTCGCDTPFPPTPRAPSGPGVREIDLAIEGIHCAGCLSTIERTLMSVKGVAAARLNFTIHRAHIAFDPDAVDVETLTEALRRAGYKARPYAADEAEARQEERARRLLRCLAVAGFGAMNVMLLSVAVWAGAGGEGVAETRDLFHWLSALIAIPVCAYAGGPFYSSALDALRGGRTNMDVPISVGVLLALSMSVVETARGGEFAYFDGATMLLFFLLCGRYLDQAMRRKTRAVVGNLAALKATVAHRVEADGRVTRTSAAELRAGDQALIQPGCRIPVDGVIVHGATFVDESLLTGETTPRQAGTGDKVYAGTLALDGAVTMRCEAASGDTLVDEIDRLIARACDSKSGRAMLADKVARLYTPVVHSAAALTIVAWLLLGASLHDALVTGISVLIITCPCALGLAAPVVQVVAAGALFRSGVVLNSADAIERIAEIDLVAFDKTGTLTLPESRVVNAADTPEGLLEIAGRLALSSRHPLAMAVAREASADTPYLEVREVAGEGVETIVEGRVTRLGRASFCGLPDMAEAAVPEELSSIAFRFGDRSARFLVRQRLRLDAAPVVASLKKAGFAIAILSGDNALATKSVADALDVKSWSGGLRPGDKIAALEGFAARGARALMVGDGLNDAPALAAAHASMSPASASDLAQARADAIFLGERLEPVSRAIEIARRARRLTLQNIAFAITYNLVAVPLAMLGHATPLIAAVAMSGSSIVVCVNALRASGGGPAAPIAQAGRSRSAPAVREARA